MQQFSTTQTWALNRIQAPNAWGLATGSSNVTVGVIDSGIWGNHPSLASVVCHTLSRDFDRSRNAPLRDDFGHGTRVAGLISAQNSGQRTSVARTVRLASLRVYDSNAQGRVNWRWVEDAIWFARSNNIQILNISLGTTGLNQHMGVRQALTAFDGLAVIAAGNNDSSNDNTRTRVYPASFSYSGYGVGGNVLSVSASSDSSPDVRIAGVNYGSNTVDLFAPGHRIVTTQGTSGYSSIPGVGHGLAGTSYAAPFAAGTAALMLSIRPNTSARLLRQIMIDTVDRNVHSSIANNSVSMGRLNAFESVRRLATFSTITNATQFNNIRNNPSGNFILGANINLAPLGQWTPIHTFSGVLEGNNRIVSGMNITRAGVSIPSDTHLGLISNLTGVVQNLTIRDSHINIASNHDGNGWIRAGILAGSIWRVGTAHNIEIDNNNSVIVHRERSSIGGLAGEVRGHVNRAEIHATTIWGNGDIGGVAGSMHDQGSIINSNVGSHSLIRHYHFRTYRSVGGIVGFHGDGVGMIRSSTVFTLTIRRENRVGSPSIGAIAGHSVDATRAIGIGFASVALYTPNAQNVHVPQALTIAIGRTGRSLLMNTWGDDGRSDNISLLCERCSEKDPADVCANCADCIAFREWYKYVNGILNNNRHVA